MFTCSMEVALLQADLTSKLTSKTPNKYGPNVDMFETDQPHTLGGGIKFLTWMDER